MFINRPFEKTNYLIFRKRRRLLKNEGKLRSMLKLYLAECLDVAINFINGF
jgi:hypothetical protein